MGLDRYSSYPMAILMRCIVIQFLSRGTLCALGSTLFRGHLRAYAPMRVAAQRGWGRETTLQLFFVAEFWGFQKARIRTDSWS